MVQQYTADAETQQDLAGSLRHLWAVFRRDALQAAARQHARGKLTVQEKLALLFDAGTFVENLAPRPDLDARHGERRLVTGHGQIQGRLVAVALFDSSIAAGSVTIATGDKSSRRYNGPRPSAPLLIDWDSGGADINDGVASLDILRQIFTEIAEDFRPYSHTLAPLGSQRRGGAYAPVMTYTMIMIDGSMMAVTGPRVIKVATGEEVTPDEMGGAQLHREKSGEAHYRVPDYPQRLVWHGATSRTCPRVCGPFHPVPHRRKRRRALRFTRHCDPGPAQRTPQAQCELGRATFIDAAVDDHTWLEYHEKFAPSAVVGFARVAGIAVAIIANQRLVLGGAMTAAASSKITHFLKLANAYHLPVVTLVDVPGFIATQANRRDRSSPKAPPC